MKLWEYVGRLIHFLGLPIIKYLLNGSARTRVLVIYGTKVLVVKTWIGSGRWGMPGGGIHKAESKIDSAIREVYEEVGIKLRPSDLEYVSQRRQNDDGVNVDISLFITRIENKKPIKRQILEIVDAQWLEFIEINPANSSPDLFEAVRKYMHLALT